MTFTNQSLEYGPDGRLRLPGFGLPIDAEPQIPSCFVHPLSGNHFESDGLKLREIRMMDFISFVTDKPNWEVEVFHEETLRTWLEEARLAHLRDLDDDVFFSEEMYKACVDELHEKATYLNNTGIVHVLDAELAVAKSDTIVPPTVAAALRHNAEALELSLKTKDWEPGSDYTVLNLLNPSLFPLVYGTTRVLPRQQDRITLDNCLSHIGEGETIGEFDRVGMRRPAYRGATQWLPSNIEWSETGPRISSYVNSLHPTGHRDLYHVLERFIAAAVPLWEDCLFRGQDRRAPRIGTCPSGNGDYFLPEDAEPEYQFDGQVGWCLDYEWWAQNRILRWPEPSQYVSRLRPFGTKPNLRRDFPGGLQVSFRLRNVHLTPENPVYLGGNWHIGGALNDRVVATALYYYDMDNISESILSFAQVFDSSGLALQSSLAHVIHPDASTMLAEEDTESMSRWYGMEAETRFQTIGEVLMRPGRLLAFPNVFQYHPGPLQLEDKTRPGHLKLLAMYLVDPHIRVLSTGCVPPQQREWWELEVAQIRPLSQLPAELFLNILEFVFAEEDFPLSDEQGRAARNQSAWEQSQVYCNYAKIIGSTGVPFDLYPNTPVRREDL
ncbi:hypothetical protein F4821DRAFT_263977 [Hypoxylon rubiginosum]|uniref:Uncharacterized protein n=1 Tax=Hypoxylon rubiginosum TaxID=110542 RepID=A0ACC0CPS6_9PEZI|nr:hypothetical protein F4821DRAFT_263977 [Hypoxylon rubiginosum]